MAIVPTGAPPWIRTNDHTTYGGDPNKTNWHSQGVTNARTDVGAEALCRLAEDMAAVMRTAPFCTVYIVCDDVTPAAPTLTYVNQMTGVRIVSYLGSSAPTGFPSAVRNGNGDVTITWASSYLDDYGVSGNIHIVHADASVYGVTPLIPAATPTDLNADGRNESVRVRLFTLAGAAATNQACSLTVVTGTS